MPLEPAGVNVWHAVQPLEVKSALPAATAAPPEDDVVVGVVEVVVGVDVEPTVTVCTTVAGGFPSDV